MYLRFCFIKVCLFKKKKKREGKKNTCSVKERNEVQKYSIFSPHVITYVTPALIAPVVFTVIP